MDKRLIIGLIALVIISFITGAATIISLDTNPTVDGTVPVWNTTTNDWNSSVNVYFPTDGNIVCFSETCDQNIQFLDGNIVING